MSSQICTNSSAWRLFGPLEEREMYVFGSYNINMEILQIFYTNVNVDKKSIELYICIKMKKVL